MPGLQRRNKATREKCIGINKQGKVVGSLPRRFIDADHKERTNVAGEYHIKGKNISSIDRDEVILVRYVFLQAILSTGIVQFVFAISISPGVSEG